jgi:alpha-amylase/alpha-mannosidase (GH57 family)
MDKKIYLAFLWHHHQPYYRLPASESRIAGFRMPWVRLHGIKDYYGMAGLLEQFPKIKANINLVPSLLKQIKEYLAGDMDRLLFLSKKPAAELGPDEKKYILDNSFLAHPQHMIGACPRYSELHKMYQSARQRAPGGPSVSVSANLPSGNSQDGQAMNKLIKNLDNQDFTDLMVCSALVWFHPVIMEQDAQLQVLKAKGRNYTEDDKRILVEKQLDYLAEIIPMHKKLQESGQLEITTTPFYHPILPLLCNMNSALQAMPQAALPAVDQAALFEDARWQVAEAVKFYKDNFGCDVKGIWPAEGSVAPSMVPLLAEQNIGYFATDEEILAQTLGKPADRLAGFLNDLYQPYKTRNLSVIFRDQYLSNLIGFQYQRWKPADAVDHLINEIKAGARRVPQEAPLVSIILDGENPWEHYANNGIEFLKILYERLSNDADIETVRISDYLARHPPVRELDTIYAGSWINHNFAIWVGHQEDRQAWEYLTQTRAIINEHKARGLDKSVLAQVMESVYIAEGSDWFWWFGHEHSSALDDQFDLLFRKHLMNVYRILGVNVPEYLNHQIKERRQRELHSLPWSMLDIKLDGRRSDYFEWLAAGQFDVIAESGGAMDRSLDSGRLIDRVFFGFDKKHLCLRIDPAAGQPKLWPDGVYFVLNFLKPAKRRVIIRPISPAGHKPVFDILDENNGLINGPLDAMALEETLEILCPLNFLGCKPGGQLAFFIEVYSALGGLNAPCDCAQDRLLVRYPESLPIVLTVPAEDMIHVDWIA